MAIFSLFSSKAYTYLFSSLHFFAMLFYYGPWNESAVDGVFDGLDDVWAPMALGMASPMAVHGVQTDDGSDGLLEGSLEGASDGIKDGILSLDDGSDECR